MVGLGWVRERFGWGCGCEADADAEEGEFGWVDSIGGRVGRRD